MKKVDWILTFELIMFFSSFVIFLIFQTLSQKTQEWWAFIIMILWAIAFFITVIRFKNDN